MRKKVTKELKGMSRSKGFWLFVFVVFSFFLTNLFGIGGVSYEQGEGIVVEKKKKKYPPLDIAEYDFRMFALANNPLPPPSTGEEGTEATRPNVSYLWPVR